MNELNESVLEPKLAPKRTRVKKYPREALLAAATGGFLLGALLLWGSVAPSRTTIVAVSQRLTTLEDVTRTIGEQVQTLSLDIETSSTTRDEQSKLFAEKLALLSTDVSAQQSSIESIANIADASRIAQEWDPYVYRMACTFFIEGEEDEREDRGSATVERTDAGTRLLTSKHIIERKNAEFLGCTLTRPGSSEEIDVAPEAFVKNESVDYAYAPITASVPAVPFERRCPSKPEIGDRVLILGYPGIGAKESVTATEGIISGFDADLYTTSAKIEKGNSGGVVVDTQRNCFLGIPTSVLPGNVESLARILPVLGL